MATVDTSDRGAPRSRLEAPQETASNVNWAAQAPDSDAAIIARVRDVLWQAWDSLEPRTDHSLVGMVKTIIAQRDEARDNRRGEYDLRAAAEAEVSRLTRQQARLRELAKKLRKRSEFAGNFSEWHPRAAKDLKEQAAGQAYAFDEAANDIEAALAAEEPPA